jgi:hypothetical protein
MCILSELCQTDTGPSKKTSLYIQKNESLKYNCAKVPVSILRRILQNLTARPTVQHNYSQTLLYRTAVYRIPDRGIPDTFWAPYRNMSHAGTARCTEVQALSIVSSFR